nr:MAG TPA: hypothetical protein [Caudoviricetes sp.]
MIFHFDLVLTLFFKIPKQNTSFAPNSLSAQ